LVILGLIIILNPVSPTDTYDCWNGNTNHCISISKFLQLTIQYHNEWRTA